MKHFTYIYFCLIVATSLILSCSKDPIPNDDSSGIQDEIGNGNSGSDIPDWPDEMQGTDFIWNKDYIPQIKICMTENDWNSFLQDCDKEPDTSGYFKCSVVFKGESFEDSIAVAGLRIKDNIDFFNQDGNFRPEGSPGQLHSKDEGEWHMSNFELSFDKFSSKPINTLRNVRGIFLKSCRNDPTYARERFCYDLCRDFGIWTIPRNNYCTLSIHVSGDSNPAYLGIYQMIEPINSRYLSERRTKFMKDNGNLWKCSSGAWMNSISGNIMMPYNGKSLTYPYMLLNNHNIFGTAKEQLTDFITKLNSYSNDDFYSWIKHVCDVELLLKTYAVITATGTWADYWCTGQNFYLYFNTIDKLSYKVYLIPGQFDTSLGNTSLKYIVDSGIQNPYTWGKSNATLIARLLSYPDYQSIYTEALRALVMDENHLLSPSYAPSYIKELMYEASFHTNNDTGSMNTVKDMPAQWSSNKSYRISTPEDANSFFTVRAAAIRNAIASNEPDVIF